MVIILIVNSCQVNLKARSEINSISYYVFRGKDMDEQTEQKSRQEIEAQIVTKAWKDSTYKEELLSNPKFVYERELNIQFSSEVNVQVLKEDSQTFYFVLPVCPEVNELSEDQLEAIAGGGDGPYDTGVRWGKKISQLVRGGCG